MPPKVTRQLSKSTARAYCLGRPINNTVVAIGFGTLLLSTICQRSEDEMKTDATRTENMKKLHINEKTVHADLQRVTSISDQKTQL
jgi:hypothetical protein